MQIVVRFLRNMGIVPPARVAPLLRSWFDLLTFKTLACKNCTASNFVRNSFWPSQQLTATMMTVCFNHLRQQRIGMATAALSTTAATAPAAPSPSVSHLPRRHFAAAAAKSKTKIDEPDGLSYKARKAAAKQQRRETWERHQARLAHLRTRRDASPKDVKKKLFRSWFDKEVTYHHTLCRVAKREKRPWRIRVAAMVERLPVVTPDVEPWEREYSDLRDYLDTYGREYPEETGFMYAPDKPEDHIVLTDEELLGELNEDNYQIQRSDAAAAHLVRGTAHQLDFHLRLLPVRPRQTAQATSKPATGS